jgi:hypothetical protein
MPSRPVVAILAAACLASTVTPAWSQQEVVTQSGPARITSSGPRESTPKERPADVLGLDERISIDFKGGTVEQYIETVRKAAAPKAVNIFVPVEVNNIEVPAIRLQSVTLWTAWSALEPAVRQPGTLAIQIGQMGERSGSTVSSEAVQVYVDRNRPMLANPRGDSSVAPDSVEVISIADLVDPRGGSEPLMKVEDVLAAVEVASKISADAGMPVPTLKYHQASGVLIARGNPGANALVRQVVGTIRQNAGAKAEELDRAKLAKDMYDQRIAQSRAQFEMATSNAESIKKNLAEYQKLVDQGAASKMEFENVRQRYENAANDAERARQQLTLVERAGPDSVRTELAIKGQKSDLADRVAQLEREVETLRLMVGMPARQPASPPGHPGR